MQTALARLGQRVPAHLLLLLALVVLQIGSGFAKQIMSADNVMSLAFLRLTLGGLFLALILRPRILQFNRSQWIDVVGLGLAFTAFNVSIYLALIHLPLGLVATIGFLGPLSVSLIGARRIFDFIWPIVAFCGVCMLAPLGETGEVSWTDIGYGIAYACAWGFYILASARTGRSVPGLDGFVIATCIAAILISPLGYANAGYFLSTPTLIKMTVVVALFATLPFGLEFLALKRLPPRTFGILLSLEPAIASITGIFLLNEQLTLATWVAIGIVSVASVGVTFARQSKQT